MVIENKLVIANMSLEGSVGRVIKDDGERTNTEQVTALFAGLDSNSDGMLFLDEFKPFAEACGAADDVQQLFNQVDTDQEGAVSASQFLAFFQQALADGKDLDDLDDERQESLDDILQKLQGLSILVDFGAGVGEVRVPQKQLVVATATGLQETVRKARLTKIEVVVLILYTGPLFLVCAPPLL